MMVDIAALKARVSLSEVIGRTVALKRAGRELTGCCPFHADRSPSFYVDDDKGIWNCFGCGKAGDVLAYVMLLEGVSLPGAAALLGSDDWTPRDPVEVAKAAKAADAKKAAMIEIARRAWRDAAPVEGTPAAAYLASRGLVAASGCVRYATMTYPEVPGSFPVLLAAAQSVDGRVCGVQRIYLAPDGNGKADVPKAKLSLGRVLGAAIRLGPVAPELILSGSLEDGLTVAQAIPERSVWACPGEGMLASVELPNEVRSVVIAADNDPPGIAAAGKAIAAFSALGLSVRVMRPAPSFKDFNDALRGIPNER